MILKGHLYSCKKAFMADISRKSLRLEPKIYKADLLQQSRKKALENPYVYMGSSPYEKSIKVGDIFLCINEETHEYEKPDREALENELNIASLPTYTCKYTFFCSINMLYFSAIDSPYGVIEEYLKLMR